MKLNTKDAFQPITALMQKIGAPEIAWTPNAVITEIEKNGVTWEIDITGRPELFTSLIDKPSRFFTLQGKQCLLYIPQGIAGIPTKDQPKFHFMECQTILDMESKGKLERYAVTNKTKKIFSVYMKIDRFTPSHRREEIPLNVCKNCLRKYNYLGFNDKTHSEKEEIVNNFDIKLFFDECKTYFSKLPTQTDKAINEIIYTQNWKHISLVYRNSVNWCCEACGADLSNHRHLLDVHHQDGSKRHTSIHNLVALCKLCHSEQYQHQHMRITEEEKNVIYELRKRNDGALNKFVTL